MDALGTLIRSYRPTDQHEVIALWQACGLTRPWDDPQRDIARKLAEDAESFFVAEHASRVVGSAMVGYDGHRGWVYYVAVTAEHRRGGLGRRLMKHAEDRLVARGCAKLNLQVRSTNADVLDFYRQLGYTQDDVVSLGKRLIEDAPPARPATLTAPQETKR